MNIYLKDMSKTFIKKKIIIISIKLATTTVCSTNAIFFKYIFNGFGPDLNNNGMNFGHEVMFNTYSSPFFKENNPTMPNSNFVKVNSHHFFWT